MRENWILRALSRSDKQISASISEKKIPCSRLELRGSKETAIIITLGRYTQVGGVSKSQRREKKVRRDRRHMLKEHAVRRETVESNAQVTEWLCCKEELHRK